METESQERPPGAELHGEDAEARRQAAALMGSVRSERKTAAAQQNAKLPRRRPLKPLADIQCTCGRGDVTLTEEGAPAHPTTCPRGRVIRLRLKKGQSLT